MNDFFEPTIKNRALFSMYDKYSNGNISKYLSHPVKLKTNDSFLIIFALSKYEIYFKNKTDSALLLRSIVFVTKYLIILSSFLIWYFNDFYSIYNKLDEHISSHKFETMSFFLGSCSVVYWNLSTKFGSQWKYLADLYNKIYVENLGVKDKFEILYHKSTLCLDLLALDFWHHKSFSKLFAYCLESSIFYCYENYSGQSFGKLKLNRSPERDIADFNEGKLDVETASQLISKLQNDLEKSFLLGND